MPGLPMAQGCHYRQKIEAFCHFRAKKTVVGIPKSKQSAESPWSATGDQMGPKNAIPGMHHVSLSGFLNLWCNIANYISDTDVLYQWRKVFGGITSQMSCYQWKICNCSLTWPWKLSLQNTPVYSKPQNRICAYIHLRSEIKNQSSKFSHL